MISIHCCVLLLLFVFAFVPICNDISVCALKAVEFIVQDTVNCGQNDENSDTHMVHSVAESACVALPGSGCVNVMTGLADRNGKWKSSENAMISEYLNCIVLLGDCRGQG